MKLLKEWAILMQKPAKYKLLRKRSTTPFLLLIGLLAFILIMPGLAVTYIGVVQWTIAFPANNRVTSIIQTNDGGYAIIGSGNSETWIMKTDANGNMQWKKTYPDYTCDAGIQTSDGGFAIPVYTNRFSGNSTLSLIKTDSMGNIEWNQTYDTMIYMADSIVQTDDGGYVFTYTTYTSGNPPPSYFTAKVNSLGIPQWTLNFSGALAKTSDGMVVLAGTSGFVKVNSSGNIIWNHTFTGGNAQQVIQTKDGGFAWAGSDFWFVKTGSNGTKLWDKKYNGNSSASGYSLVQTNDGYVLAGTLRDSSSQFGDGWLVKTDSSGNMQWNQTFSSIVDFRSIINGSDGGFVVAAYSLLPTRSWFFQVMKIGLEPVPTATPSPTPTASPTPPTTAPTPTPTSNTQPTPTPTPTPSPKPTVTPAPSPTPTLPPTPTPTPTNQENPVSSSFGLYAAVGASVLIGITALASGLIIEWKHKFQKNNRKTSNTK